MASTFLQFVAPVTASILAYQLMRFLYRVGKGAPGVVGIAIVLLSLPLILISGFAAYFIGPIVAAIFVWLVLGIPGAFFLAESVGGRGNVRYVLALFTLYPLTFVCAVALMFGVEAVAARSHDREMWGTYQVIVLAVGPLINAAASWLSLYFRGRLPQEPPTPLELRAEAALAAIDGSTRWEDHQKP